MATQDDHLEDGAPWDATGPMAMPSSPRRVEHRDARGPSSGDLGVGHHREGADALHGAAGWSQPDWAVLDEIQSMIDEFGAELDRSIVVEDAAMRLIAFNPHHGEFDMIRQRSVFARETPVEAITWLAELGVMESTEPLRIAPRPEIGALARVMTTIRWNGELVGFLAVLDPGGRLSDGDVERCRETAEQLARLVHRLSLLHQGVEPRERERVDVLLTDADAMARRRAADELIRERLLEHHPNVVVVVEAAGSGGEEAESISGQMALRVKRSLPMGRVAATTRHDRAIFVVSLEAEPDMRIGAARIAHQVQRNLTSVAAGRRLRVAYGSTFEGPEYAAASYVHASRALAIGERVRSFGPVVGWEQLGIYQLLSAIPPSDLGATTADLFIEQLIGRPELLQTLECYLDLAGDAKRTSEQLNLHRASLYYRLGRVEEIAGVDLKDGEHRLALHVALKGLRLQGRATW